MLGHFVKDIKGVLIGQMIINETCLKSYLVSSQNLLSKIVTPFMDDPLPNKFFKDKHDDIFQVFDAKTKTLQFHRRHTIVVVFIH